MNDKFARLSLNDLRKGDILVLNDTKTGLIPQRLKMTDSKIFCLSCKDPSYVFVFGDNERQAHGRGGAKHAVQYHGAKNGVPYFCGNSYGISTKDSKIKTLPLTRIAKHVERFLEFAKTHSELKFFVTRIGCGLAGYEDRDMAPMFAEAPDNCVLSERWRKIINEQKERST